MKVGLLTYHFSDNYGALFQAYALRKWFLNYNVDAEFLNYAPSYVEQGGPLDRPWDPRRWRKNATILYMRQAYLQRRFFGDQRQRAGFEKFRQETLGVTGPLVKTAAGLRVHMPDYDLLICGSDQIWNPSIQRGLDPVYFLDIPGSKRHYKLSYAASFGRDSVESKHLPELHRLLAGLDAVSVRESSALDVIEASRHQRNLAQVVPDPTILLGRFDEILGGPAEPDGRIFCYALRTDKVIRDVAFEAGRILGAEVVAPRTTHQRWKDIGVGITPDPVEWLQTLARSRMVVSNSFHGVALSVVLNRPFIAVALPGKRAGLNARVQNLLSIAGLTDRIVTRPNPAIVRALAETTIDWDSVNACLAAVRAEAEAYLDSHIAAARAGAA